MAREVISENLVFLGRGKGGEGGGDAPTSIKWDLYYALCISVWLISAAGPYLCEGCHPSLEERANLWVYLKAFELPICICRSSAQDERGLLAAGVAGAPTFHRHGDQSAGG